MTDSLHAYQLAKRGNSLPVMAEAVWWGRWGARVNTISPGISFTPRHRRADRPGLPGHAGVVPVGRGGTPDEVATVGGAASGPDGGFITGSEVLIDGGVTASYRFGDLAPP